MKRKQLVLILVALVMVAFVGTGTARADERPTHYTVVFTTGKLPQNAAGLVARAGGELVQTLPEVNIGVAVSSNPDFAQQLSRARGVVAVGEQQFYTLPEPVALHPLEATEPTAEDVYYDLYQWDIRRVQAPDAWAMGVTGSHDTVVSVIDTGVAWNHPDLDENVVFNTCYTLFSPCTAYPQFHWHGTHVAGTVAAEFGDGKVVGVGPNLGIANYNVFEVVELPGEPGEPPVPVLVAFDGPIWQAMIDTANQGFDVINMSLGGYSVKTQDAATWVAWNRVADYVTRQGVTIVASAGNGSVDLNGPLYVFPSDVTGIVNVSATGIRPQPAYPTGPDFDVLAFYSNYGAPITVAAPGGDCGPDYPATACNPLFLIMSSYVEASPTCAVTASCPVDYAWSGGTSMASPHVAGVAGLVRSVDSSLTPHQVISIVKRTSEDIGSRLFFGQGMVNAGAAASTATK